MSCGVDYLFIYDLVPRPEGSELFYGVIDCSDRLALGGWQLYIPSGEAGQNELITLGEYVHSSFAEKGRSVGFVAPRPGAAATLKQLGTSAGMELPESWMETMSATWCHDTALAQGILRAPLPAVEALRRGAATGTDSLRLLCYLCVRLLGAGFPFSPPLQHPKAGLSVRPGGAWGVAQLHPPQGAFGCVFPSELSAALGSPICKDGIIWDTANPGSGRILVQFASAQERDRAVLWGPVQLSRGGRTVQISREASQEEVDAAAAAVTAYVHISGLPPHVTEDDIGAFLAPIPVSAVYGIRGTSDVAVVCELESPVNAIDALRYNGHPLREQGPLLTVTQTTAATFAAAAAVAQAAVSDGRVTVSISGFPRHWAERELARWLGRDAQIAPRGMHLKVDADGNSTGQATAELKSAEGVAAALARSGQTGDGAVITVSTCV